MIKPVTVVIKQHNQTMNRFLLIVSITLAILMLQACDSSNAGKEEQTKQKPDKIPVNIQQVEQKTIPVNLQASGNIEAWEKTYIAGQSGVRIHQIYADEGDHVQKGRLLVRMNNAQVEQARENYELAKSNLQRLDTLVKIGSISEQRYEQAESEMQTARSQLNMLQENTVLRAPFTGTVTAKHFVNGALFMPGANNPAILTLMQMQPVKLNVNISERYYSKIHKGIKVKIRADAYPDTVFDAVVHKKHPVIDKTTRTFRVEVQIPNKERLLRPGMFAKATIELGRQKGIYIPYAAITRQAGSGKRFVYVVDKSHKAVKKEIRTGLRHDDMIEVKSGISEHEALVTEGIARLEGNEPVKIINQ